MIILGIDTVNDVGSLALSYGAETIEEVTLRPPEGFSSALFGELAQLLERNALRLEEIDLYAVATGPGSFTGVRIGIAAAKSLAEANQKPCYGFSNLAALAQFGSEDCRAAFVDARKGEIYGGVFGTHFAPEVVMPFPEWLAGLPAEATELLTVDFAPFENALRSHGHLSRTTVPAAVASALCEMALDRFRAGDKGDPAAIDANYVRRPYSDFKP